MLKTWSIACTLYCGGPQYKQELRPHASGNHGRTQVGTRPTKWGPRTLNEPYLEYFAYVGEDAFALPQARAPRLTKTSETSGNFRKLPTAWRSRVRATLNETFGNFRKLPTAWRSRVRAAARRAWRGRGDRPNDAGIFRPPPPNPETSEAGKPSEAGNFRPPPPNPLCMPTRARFSAV